MASNLRVDSIVPATGSSVSIGTATGGVNIPGVLTYEDVTNVDSVGVITARSGIKIGATGANTLISGTATGIGIGTDSPGSPLEVNGGTSVDTATFNSHNANGVLINLQRSGSSKGFLGSGKNIADATGGVDDIGLRSNANLIFTSGGGTDRARFDSSGRLLKGLTTARGNYANNTSGVEYGFQIEATNATKSSLSLIRSSNDANDGGIILGKTRSTSVGGNTVVQAGDDLGTITWAGSDGTSLQFGAEIFAEVQTGVGNDDLPTDLIVKTNGGSTSTSERLRITSAGQLLVGTATTNETNETLVVHQSTAFVDNIVSLETCLLYTSPSPRDRG